MCAIVGSVVFAVHVTPWERLTHLPRETWINFALCLLAAVIIFRLWRLLKTLNDYGPYVAMGIAATMIFFYWVYSRTEPKFLSPLVERVAPFFPSRAKQQEDIEKFRRSRRESES